MRVVSTDWKCGNFRENFIFTNSFKRHPFDVENSRLGYDQPISINDRVNSPFRECIIFRKLDAYAKFHENKTLAKKSKFTVSIAIFICNQITPTGKAFIQSLLGTISLFS